MTEPTLTTVLVSNLHLALPFLGFGFLLGILGTVLERTTQEIDTVVQIVLLLMVLALVGPSLGSFLLELSTGVDAASLGYVVIVLVFAPILIGDFVGGKVISGKKSNRKQLP